MVRVVRFRCWLFVACCSLFGVCCLFIVDVCCLLPFVVCVVLLVARGCLLWSLFVVGSICVVWFVVVLVYG